MRVEQVPPYVVWPIRQQVLYPQKDLDSVKLEDDANGMHFALFAGNELKSVVSVFVGDKRLQFRKLATITNQQGQGYGSEMIRYIIDFAVRESISVIWCNARLSAAEFYQKFGFRTTDRQFVKDNIEFVVMELELEQA